MSHPAARGIVMMIAAVGCFALMDAAMKQLGEGHTPMQVAFLRGAASLPLVLLALGMTGRLADLKPVRWKLHLARGLMGIAMLWLFIYAVRLLSLADAYSIYLSAPLLITALSVPLLGERVKPQQWLAICVGLAGVLVMLRPSVSGFVTLGGLAAFLSAAAYAMSAIWIRVLARTETAASMVFWAMAIIALVAGTASIPGWRPIAPSEWPWIAGLGISGAGGQYFITQAFRLAPASVVAPFEYTALLWGVGLDWLLWQVLPESRMFAGAALVIVSGLYLIARQRHE